jgi:membrane-bound lytic murein transglycosylase B
MKSALLLLTLFAAAPLAQQTTAPPPAQVVAADPPPIPFDTWLADLRKEASSKGVSDETLDQAFANLAPDPVIVARDRTQPEQMQSLDEYISTRLNRKLLTRAADAATTHGAVAKRVDKAYGVPAPVMIAIWGIESNFGQFTGVRPVITALATLAYDSRRPALFRAELIQALTIVDKRMVTLPEFVGSWAGAIGQPQFMPSSFVKYAVDFDGDGKIDIWTSPADVLGSMANYLKASGWNGDERWGREVKISPATMAKIEKAVPMRASGCKARREMTDARPLNEWKKLGVTLTSGALLPASSIDASLVRGVHRNFLVYRNYEAILDYNCSNAYAISVGLLSDKIKVK